MEEGKEFSFTRIKKYYLACQDGRWTDEEFDTYEGAAKALENSGPEARGLCIQWYWKDIPLDNYDSTADTLAHIRRVQELISRECINLIRRGINHDQSKLWPEEKEYFDRETPLLRHLEFGSPDYKESLARLKPALDHHYAANSHHPEHYANGINDMSLTDVVEMLCDWKAASERSKDRDFTKSLDICFERFKVGPQLQDILRNTARRRGWIK